MPLEAKDNSRPQSGESLDATAGKFASPIPATDLVWDGDVNPYGAGGDAVLAAFSHDNTTYATNYQQHALDVDYAVSLQSVLNLTAYYYRRKDFALAVQPGDNDFITRLRLNLQYSFD